MPDNFLESMYEPIILPPDGADPEACLAPTDVIESDHPDIVAQATALTAGLDSPFERAVALFTFVRDRVVYYFAPDLLSRDDWRASRTLARGNGFCQQKAVLLAALARAAGIPSAIGFQHLRDHKLLDTRYERVLPGGIIAYHGLTYFWLDGAWYIADATLDAALCRRRRYRLVELRPGEHARLPATDLDGRPHFDFLAEFGPYPNLPESVSEMLVRYRPVWLELRRLVEETGVTM